MNRRSLLRSAGVMAGVSLLSRRFPAPLAATSSENAAPPIMQPYRIKFGKDRIRDLYQRIDLVPWPDMPYDTGWTTGTSDRVLRDMVQHWRHKYDWFAVQERLNKLNNLRGLIGGDQLHCVLYKGTGKRQPFPLLMLHGWPGSYLEFVDAAALLVDAGYDVVVPSLPGYAFSEAPHAPGMNVSRMAERMHMLMRALGYQRYGVQGGDWGAYVGVDLALQQPQAVVGLHLNFGISPAKPADQTLTTEEQQYFAQRERAMSERRSDGVGELQAGAPQTIAYALHDSPVGTLAWILWRYWRLTDHDMGEARWTEAFQDRVLDTVMVYWLPGRVLSASRIYWESPGAVRGGWISQGRRVTVPTGYARRGPGGPTPSVMELGYNLVYESDGPQGAHFAAMEYPQAFAKDVNTFFSRLVSSPTA